MTAAAPGSLFGTFLSYQERNADAFFGRADDAARLDKLLIGASHLIVLTGPSGVGKTSVLRAGLTQRPHPPRADRRDADQLPRPRARAGARDQRGGHRAARCRDRTRPTFSAASRATRAAAWC